MRRIYKTLFACAAALMIMCGCGRSEEPKGWLRDGYFTDGQGNFLSITLSEEGGDLGIMIDSRIYMGSVEQDGKELHGRVTDTDSGTVTVTVSEEGEEGLLLSVEGGRNYHFTKANFADE